jgi:Family of unknown function (DUF5631)/Family of unknown function (DUF5632)
VGIFGRQSARQRLRRATRESLTIPTFTVAIDCTPWVIGGLWPAELSATTPETATLAEHLNADLQRIVRSANEELRSLRRAGLTDPSRQAAEANVVSAARARAERRVESTLRYLHNVQREAPASDPRAELDTTQVIPTVTAEPPPADALPVAAEDATEQTEAPEVPGVALPAAEVDAPAVATPEPVFEAPEVAPEAEPDGERLQRLLAFVARQEPRLNWAVGNRADGTTLLVTDLAHGWIPSGIAVPDGVRLLEPERRSGKITALLGDTTHRASYAPGDSMGRRADPVATQSAVWPRELPAVPDLGWVLGEATHWRDGLPRIVHTMARAAAAGTGVAEAEIDVLRVHLDTARHRLLGQYPDVEPTALLDCLLLSATESLAAGDPVSANYHLAWFQKLSA